MSIMSTVPKGAVVEGINKNLLTNWYFVGGGSQLGYGIFPINQRGQTSYTGPNDAFTIDRWLFNAKTDGILTVNSTSITIDKNTASQSPGIAQQFNAEIDGRYLTFSLLDSSGNLFTSTSPSPMDKTILGTWQFNTNFSSFWMGIRMNANGLWQISVTSNSLAIVAIKVELGKSQTLCHNEGTSASPVWALNEVPDYDYELYRCLTQSTEHSDSWANKTLNYNSPNDNVLDNGIFIGGGSQQGECQLPINQRGQTSYEANQFTIDRWYATSYITTTIESDCISLACSGSNQYFQQRFEFSRLIPGQYYTFSTLVKAVNVGTSNGITLRLQYDKSPYTNYVQIPIATTGLHSVTFLYTAPTGGYTGPLRASINMYTGSSISIQGIKLELGTQSTLARYGSAGNLVINDRPNYQEELLRCQRYYNRLVFTGASTYGQIGNYTVYADGSLGVIFSVPVPMRANPTPSFTGTMAIVKCLPSIGYVNSNITVQTGSMVGNIISMGVVNSTITKGDAGFVQLNGALILAAEIP